MINSSDPRFDADVLVTGAAGFIGAHLVRRLAREYRVAAAVHRAPLPAAARGPNVVELPLDLAEVARDQDAFVARARASEERPPAPWDDGSVLAPPLWSLIERINPRIVFHAGAVSSVTAVAADESAARRVNVDATRALLETTVLSSLRADRRFVFFSTDLVFDGRRPWWRETDPPGPRHAYGRSKADAEAALAELAARLGRQAGNICLVRIALCYGPTLGAGQSTSDWVVRSLRAGKPLSLFTDEYRTPVAVDDVVEALAGLVPGFPTTPVGIPAEGDRATSAGASLATSPPAATPPPPLGGGCAHPRAGVGGAVPLVLHLSGPERLDRHTFGVMIARAAGLPPELLAPARVADATGEPRPADMSLAHEATAALIPWRPRPAAEALAAMYGDRRARGGGAQRQTGACPYDGAMEDPAVSMHTPWRRRAAHAGLALLAVGAACFAAFAGPLPQDPAYHDFADRRAWGPVPNAADVLSNLPFLAVGAGGLAWIAGRRGRAGAFEYPSERLLFAGFFAAVALVAAGSAYYHRAPGNDTLLWDRLPMSAAFMLLFAAFLGERLGPHIARASAVPLAALGVGSVLWWHWGEQAGSGDLRLYALVQFVPLAAIPCVMLGRPSRYTRGADYLVALAWYLPAKGLELSDRAIFAAGGLVSGHTLKHLAAAAACAWVWRMLARRHPRRLVGPTPTA